MLEHLWLGKLTYLRRNRIGRKGLGEMGLGEVGLGEVGLGEMGLGEMGLGETGGHPFNSFKVFSDKARQMHYRPQLQ